MLNFDIVFIIYRIILYISLMTLFYFLLLLYLPNSAVNLSMSQRNFLITLFPQGWSFFAKSPREKRVSLYIETNELKEYDFIKYRLHDYLGFNREERKFISDIMNKASYIDKNEWISSQFKKILTTKSPINFIYINNNSWYYKEFCNNNYIFVIHKPKIWAWRNYEDTQNIIYTRVKFICK